MAWALAHSVEEAAWAENLDPLAPLAGLSVMVGLVAAKSGLRPWAAHVGSALIGLETIVLVYANRLTPAPWEARLAELFGHVGVWLGTAIGGGNSRDNLVFVLVMAALAWTIGYVASWLVFRHDKGWAALVLTGSALLIHLSSSYASLNYHFWILLFAGLLLLAQLELSRSQARWRASGMAVQHQVRRNVVLTSGLMILAIIGLAQRGPSERSTDFLEPAWARVSDSWQRAQSHVDRLFGGVQGPPVVAVGLAFSSTMQPREGFELGTAPVLRISAPRSRYWRTTTYDLYTGQGFVSGVVDSDRIEADQPIPVPFGAGLAREEMEQTVTVLAPQSNLVFAADAPIRVSVPTMFEWRQATEDLAALRLTTVIRRGQQYTVTSMASVATDRQLRSAGTEYPAGVERYLQLPEEVPQRVRQLAREVAGVQATPYDRALVVERFLRSLPYETTVPAPPQDRDWVDYTLFDAQAGYSDSYSTAMAVMLRSLGIPARVASGFAPTEFDENEAGYIVTESDAHSWTEVFFPAYGWITFEPSSFRATPFRPSEDVVLPPDAPLDEMLAEGAEPFTEDLFGDGGGASGESVPAPRSRADEAWVAGLALLGGLLLAAAAAYVGLLALFRRGFGGLPWHVQWYAQLRRLAAWAGLGGRPSDTPHEYARWLEERFPGSEPLVRPIADCYVEGAYSGHEPDPETLARAATAWEEARRPLARRVLLRGVIYAEAQIEALRRRLGSLRFLRSRT